MVPIENASMPGRTVVQWDKDDLDALGILKVDCLALGMLSAIRRSLDLIERAHRPIADPGHHPRRRPRGLRDDSAGRHDRRLSDRIPRQMSMLPRLKPKEFYDLVIEVAIVRPGPIQGNMVHPYLRRRNGQEPVEYPSEAVREVLKKTLGVPLFQEQAMRLVVVAAGFTPGEADQLRRAMGAWRRTGVIEQFEQKLIDGMLANGYTEEFARNLFQQIEGFGSYGFPESHAASFALLVYVSAWIKCHHPAVFLAALLNSQPMGFYGPAQLVADARRHGVEVRPVDVNHSDWDSTLERSGRGRHWPCGSAGRWSRGCRRPRRRRWSASAESGHSRRMAISSHAPDSRRQSCPAWPRPMRSARSASTRGRPTGCRWRVTPLEPLFADLPDEAPPPCRGFRPQRKSSMTTMPRDSRCAAIPSRLCARP